MKDAKYWMALGNMDQWALGVYSPTIALQAKYEPAYLRGFIAGLRGVYWKKGWKAAGASY